MARSTKRGYTLRRELKVANWVVVVMVAGALTAGCGTTNCSDVGCLGQRVSVELVDEAGNRVSARGDLSYSHHSTEPFDCTLPSDGYRGRYRCEDGVLTLPSVHNPDTTIKVRFQQEDGTLTDWQPVELNIEKRVVSDFNGPGCDCTVYDGTTEPVTVPEAAR
jgi:hypothetical protein